MAEHLCPVWCGYILANPLRKLVQNPDKILGPRVREGMTALDVGCAMGFFSLPLARMVGPNGKVVCVDLQEKMISNLERRAAKAGLAERMQPRLCSRTSLNLGDLAGQVDFALAFAVVHEVPSASAFFEEVNQALKPGARLLAAEPKGPVKLRAFEASIASAQEAGFEVVDRPRIHNARAVLLSKK